LSERAAEPLLEVLALGNHLGAVLVRDEPLLGLNRERGERRVQRDGGDEEREEQARDSHRLGHAAGAHAQLRQ
jgi:hypothetical protein